LREKKLQDLKDNELQVTYKVLLKQRNAFIQEIQDIFEEIKKNNYLNLLNTDLDRYQSTLKEEVETLSSMPKTIFHVMMSVRIFKELNNAANPMNFNPETFWEKQAHLGYISSNSNLNTQSIDAAEVIGAQTFLYGLCVASVIVLMALTIGALPPVGILFGLSTIFWLGTNIANRGKLFSAEHEHSPNAITMESTKMGRKVHAMFKTQKEILSEKKEIKEIKEINSVKTLDRREYKQNP